MMNFPELEILPSGLMIYARSKFDLGEFETHLIVKEEEKYLQTLQPKQLFNFHSALIQMNNVSVVVLMMKVENDQDMLYESWWNFYQSQGKESFINMSIQEKLRILFFNEKNDLKIKKEINNGLSLAFCEYLNNIRYKSPWTMKDFDKAKEDIYNKYPTPKKLWEAIG
jgi:hypothetical protein